MRCEVCSHENPPRSRFCVQCGRLLDASWLTPTPEGKAIKSMGGLSGRIGDRMGDYILLALLGEGGMGRVYQARNSNGEEVAIKMLPPLREGDQASRRLLRREGEILSRLIHPNIVRFDDFLEDGGRLALVMELLEGQTLQEKLVQGPMAPDIVASLLLDILEGLIYAHQQGVIHRDLKPSNLFLVEALEHKLHAPTLRVKIGDFGLARIRFEKLSTTLGEHVGEAGTVQYMAPEQLQHLEFVDARSDLYALGVIAYEVLVGARMIRSGSHLQMLQQILHEPPPPLDAGLLDRLPLGFAQWHQKLLAKDPKDRFANAETARTSLLGLLGHEASAYPAKQEDPFEAPQASTAQPLTASPKTASQPEPSTSLLGVDPLAWSEVPQRTADFDRDELGLEIPEKQIAEPLSRQATPTQERHAIFSGAASPLNIPATGDLASSTPLMPQGFRSQNGPAALSPPTSPSQGTSDFDREAYLAYQRSLQNAAPTASQESNAANESFEAPEQVESFMTLRDDDERVAGFQAQLLAGVPPERVKYIPEQPPPDQDRETFFQDYGQESIQSSPSTEPTEDFQISPQRSHAQRWFLLALLFAVLGVALWWAAQKGMWHRVIASWQTTHIFSKAPKDSKASRVEKDPPTAKAPKKSRFPHKRLAPRRKRPPVLRTQTPPPSRPAIPKARHTHKPLRVPRDLKRMAKIPKGWFPFGGLGSPSPIQWRRLPTFWMDRYEVTWHDYAICVKAGRCDPLSSAKKRGFSRHNQPVVGITWEEAATYCRFRHKRLPSSLEWEKAARGFEGQIFPFSGTYPDCKRAVYGSPASRTRSCPKNPKGTMFAGSRPLDRSPFGIFDMAGNVREWTRDCASNAEKRCTRREARGGSWLSSGSELLAARRWNFSSSARRWDLGFRCVWP